jgi:catechol 2,3-dioxygenase-like lactoylglutathione lyase family enzyme
MVSRVQNVYYVVADMDRSVEFYRETLGLDLRFRDGDRWTQFSVGASSLSLSSRDEAATGVAGAVVVLEVDDLAAARERLRAGHAHVFADREMGAHGRSLAFRDPDGNVVQLLERACG